MTLQTNAVFEQMVDGARAGLEKMKVFLGILSIVISQRNAFSVTTKTKIVLKTGDFLVHIQQPNPSIPDHLGIY